MNINLSPRLLAAASLIRGGGIVADIGTDHGYLPIYLIQQGKIPGAIAADIGKQPLENAAKSVYQYGLTDKIELRLSDGLVAFSPDDASEFVIAGMGGTLIAQILGNSQWIKDSRYHFVFQPQSRAEELREYLYNNGFEIGREIVCCEGRRYYLALDAVYTGVNTPYTQAECFLGKMEPSQESVEYIRRQISRLTKKYEALGDESPQKADLLKILDELREFTND